MTDLALMRRYAEALAASAGALRELSEALQALVAADGPTADDEGLVLTLNAMADELAADFQRRFLPDTLAALRIAAAQRGHGEQGVN